ncbi:MAG TPA: hypothetical protein VE134_04745 [Methanomicrobiales archaeon]|nr:hypothetical protein [Methanomicrobiales archaeon]
MHEGGSHVHHMQSPEGHLIGMMWKNLSEDQAKRLMMRMLDEKIMKKEQYIQLMQHKVETYRMARRMLEESQK